MWSHWTHNTISPQLHEVQHQHNRTSIWTPEIKPTRIAIIRLRQSEDAVSRATLQIMQMAQIFFSIFECRNAHFEK